MDPGNSIFLVVYFNETPCYAILHTGHNLGEGIHISD